MHGDVALIGELGVKAPFCDIPKDGCSGMKTQSCNDGTPIRKGDSFCFCSGIKEVPVSPDVSNIVKVLIDENCQKFERVFG